MPYLVVDLGSITVTSSGNPVNTNGVGALDDASSVTLIVTTSGNWSSTAAGGITVQVTQTDPFSATPSGVSRSTGWYNLTNSTGGVTTITSSGVALTINNVSFRGIRLNNLASASSTDVVGYAMKQITV